ncbi:MAG: type I-C CRISPR-associated protein Cas5 [Dehalococcoidia bacterium]|nr:type I-C CRISPR-associated protein Cas5c [Chloroflexota bacterium]MXY72607.1 type I-C CRISPR-associated protein Cas5 [Dehalococcoidia bacterium]MYG19887.1 type I-C CRISPR-associated protein Cas5 [Gemmatimonadales bacterium]
MVRGLPPLEVKLWGEYACFTRPEMKVERVTYPVMTPSAARGALEAIFWKPQVTWRIEEIHVLNPVAYTSILRNEINDRQSERTARGWARNGGGYDAADRRSRAQRHTLALRDVAYVVRAQLVLQDGVADDIAKYRDQFRRRVARGQCFATPYLGCREFSASFGEPEPGDAPIERTEDLGLMLLDIDYDPDGSGRGTPMFFDASLDRGVLRVPDRLAGVA